MCISEAMSYELQHVHYGYSSILKLQDDHYVYCSIFTSQEKPGDAVRRRN